MSDAESRHALVFALAHEVGNHLAVALARVLVADAGGRVDVESGNGRSRVRFRLPRG